MILRTLAISNFLKAKAASGEVSSDLVELYTPAMECQVNVAQDGGEIIQGEFKGRNWNGYTDGIQTWKAFRIPNNAGTQPQYDETSVLSYSLDEHADSIGMTGWDWKNQVSRWVAFDFDAIIGHSEKHSSKLSDQQIEQIKTACSSIPWVTVRKSTGGLGLHLYVFLAEPESTANHNEHAALGRAVLGQLSALSKFDFNAKVDICGGNMWVWHRKLARTNNQGLRLIKAGEPLKEIPKQWRDHVKVVTGQRRRVLQVPENFVPSEISAFEEMFLELTGQSTHTPLDDEHKRLIEWLLENQFSSWWDADHHMLVTHTYFLKKAHEELSLRGIFTTLAAGENAPRDWNAFAFPLRRGGWAVRRYAMGVRESDSWEQDGKGWTRCFFNTEPDLMTASRANGGVERPTGGFAFREAAQAQEAAQLLGSNLKEIPIALRSRAAVLRPHKDNNRMIMEIETDANVSVNVAEMPGWFCEKGKWKRVFPVQARQHQEMEVANYDDMIRHLVTEGGVDYGWTIRSKNEMWRTEPFRNVMAALEAQNMTNKEVKAIMGNSVLNCWQMVNQPFQPEYPGNRMWNRSAAQLRFVPSQDIDNLSYPAWKSILDHIGQNLDYAVKEDPWMVANGVFTGADYLKLWIASLFQFPYEPLPYLFLYGSQNCGKSILHEALAMLLTKGHAKAEIALTNPSNFNGELEGALLCSVEEVDLRHDKYAFKRIKDWVTAREISIHIKGRTPFHVPNTTHWIQSGNSITFCPVFPGDTRITLIHVPDLPLEKMIPKSTKFLPMLEDQAPDFLAAILNLEIPPAIDRLRIPVLATAEKIEAEESNLSTIERFARDNLFNIPGEVVSVADMHKEFISHCQLNNDEGATWSKQQMGRELVEKIKWIVKGRGPHDSTFNFGNVSLVAPKDGPPKVKLIPANRGATVFLINDPFTK